MRESLGGLALLAAIYCFAALFLIYPIVTILVESLYVEGRLTLELYQRFLSSPFNLRILWNSVLASFLTVLASSFIGVTLAYILARYRIKGRSILMTLSVLPMVMPPFVGALAFIFLFGNAGTINLVLIDWLKLTTTPINLVKGLHGVVLIETVHLYPLIYLNTAAAFTGIDPALEEAAEIQGASGLRRFFTVTLRLATPGYAAGAFLVFIWTFADWTTPAILGLSNQYLASQTLDDITQFFEEERLRLGLVGAATIILLSVASLFAMRKYVELRQYVSLTKGTVVGGRILELSGSKKALAYAFCYSIGGISLLAPVWIGIGAFGTQWGLTPFPTSYTLEHFRYIALEAPLYLSNSFQYSSLAALLDLSLGVAAAFLLARIRIPGRYALDGLVTVALAIPGIVLGVGYLRAFHRLDLPLIGQSLTSLWVIMPIVIAVRRLPYVVRSSYASLLQMDTALEEASEILGASRARTFGRITMPLIARGVFAGTIFSFVTAIQEVSASMLLYRPGWETIPIGTFIFFTSSGDFGRAAALGFVLLVVTGVSIALANRFGARRLGGAFGI